MEFKDYYQTLGVTRDADEKEIKRAFRKLAQKYHPDKNPGDQEAEQRFKEINEAYTVLSDADKRAKYDRFGSQWEQYSRAGGRPEDFDWSNWAGGGGTRTRTVTPEDFEQMFGGMGGNGSFSSFFDTLFGGGFGTSSPGGGAQYRTRSRPGQRFGFDTMPRERPTQTEVAVDVSLEEAFAGATRLLQSEDETRLEVQIPRGVQTGSKIRMRDTKHGDIYLKVNVLPHELFERDGDNLRVKVQVDLVTAVLGGEVQVPTMERPVVLTIPAGTQNGKIFRLRGLGMPNLKDAAKRGDLLAMLDVRIPQNLSANEKKLFEQLRDLRASS